MHSLQLIPNLIGWRVFIRRREDASFQKVMRSVFNRDNYVCQYCGFQAKIYQEVVNVDGNYRNAALTNLATACCLCAQCLFLQAVGMDEVSGGQLIYFPEVSQDKLNAFCHVLFCAIGNSTGYQDSAQMVYRNLKFRSQPVENSLGSGMSDPATLGKLIIEYYGRFSVKKLNILQDIRLLPSYAKFKPRLTAWADAASKELESESVVKRED